MANMFINAMTDIWTSGGTVYNAIKMTVTDSASDSTSKIINLIGGSTGTTPLFSVNKVGNVEAAGTLTAAGTITGTTVTGTTVVATTAVNPDADDGAALGTTLLGWSDLYGATGFTLNIANGNAVVTHSSGIFTVSTGDWRVTTAGANAASVVTVGGTQTLTGKTINLTDNTLSGTLAQFNTALSGDNFVSLTGSETLTNKTLTAPTITGGTFSGAATGTFNGTTVAGTTGTFSGAVSMTGLTATTGTFSGAVSMAALTATTGTFSSTLTASGNVTASSAGFVGNSGGAILSANGEAGVIYLRPRASGTNQTTVDSNGDMFVSGGVYADTGYFVGNGINVFLAATTGTTGAVYLRPRGHGSGTNQAYIDSADGEFHVVSVSEYSDETLKRDFRPSNKALVDDISALEIGSYKWIDTDADGYGVKAQALRDIMPEVVHARKDGTLGVNYGKAAMAAVIDAAKRIIALEARIAELEGKG